MLSAATIDTVARLALVSMFPPSAVDKLVHWRGSLRQCESAGLPGGAALAAPMVLAAAAVEFVTPILIVAHVWDRPAALLLAAFCVVTAFLYHPFWRGPDLFTASDTSVARDHFWQFLKNFGIVGGLLLVALAGQGWPGSKSTSSRRRPGPIGGNWSWLWVPACAGMTMSRRIE